MKNFYCFSVLILIFSYAPINAQETLLRFPDIHEDLVVFSYGEDLWTASSDGGIATRITFDDGEERFPKFSNDGSLIAFTGNYDGNGDVYVMNKYGGDITRVTFHPTYDEVIGWHPVKNKILLEQSNLGEKNKSLNHLKLGIGKTSGCEFILFRMFRLLFALRNEYSLDFLILLGQAKSKNILFNSLLKKNVLIIILNFVILTYFSSYFSKPWFKK